MLATNLYQQSRCYFSNIFLKGVVSMPMCGANITYYDEPFKVP